METLRDDFLRDAALLLFSSSPTTSSHISAERFRQCANPSEPRCPACGTLLVQGLNASLTYLGMNSSRRKEPTIAVAGHQNKLLQLTRCEAFNRIAKCFYQSNKPPRQYQRRAINQTKVAKIEEDLAARHNPRTPASREVSQSKISSKKRAQTRKDREGLQSLLARSQKKNTYSSFSLMDFMKP